MNENDYQRDLKAGLTAQGWWAYKIPDSAMGMTKPCDIVACARGVHVAIECKLVKVAERTIDAASLTALSSVSFKGREHQLEHLREINSIGGLGIVAVGIYQTVYPYEKFSILIRSDKIRRKSDGNVTQMKMDEVARLGVYMTWNPGVGWTIDLTCPEVRRSLTSR